jgi:hypothetical protein
MSDEPDPDLHHIFDDIETAQAFFTALMEDMSLTDEQREMIKGPRQAHGNTWIIDKVN